MHLPWFIYCITYLINIEEKTSVCLWTTFLRFWQMMKVLKTIHLPYVSFYMSFYIVSYQMLISTNMNHCRTIPPKIPWNKYSHIIFIFIFKILFPAQIGFWICVSFLDKVRVYSLAERTEQLQLTGSFQKLGSLQCPWAWCNHS